MIYVAALREIWNRLNLQALPYNSSNPKPNGLLYGLHVKPNGEYRVDGEKDLPQLSMTELEAGDGEAKTDGNVTMFLRTSRKHGWVSMRPTDKDGLFNWAEKVLDAIEISPSTGKSDALLHLHKADGTAILKDGLHIALLNETFTTQIRMSEITDLSFLAEITIKFNAANTRRSTRRSTIVSNADY